ncbi:MAG: SDR family NAD(P)-dependent oxidoreductase [Elusimicrobiaceae bacterium]|nr:SDR family NAD(P)-dependent oxidoreductase [Elusimicrobiaceae bacterium]
MTSNKKGKVLLLGASGGIGSAIAAQLKKEKYLVTAPAHRELDLADPRSIDAYFENHPADFYAVIHSAGYNCPKPVGELTAEDVDKTYQINCRSLFGVLEHVLPHMKKRKAGSIVAISSIYGLAGRRGRLAYVTSKHALNGLIKSLAVELGEYNIRVNAVSPGYVDTALTRKNNTGQTIKGLVEQIPLGRMAAGSEIAGAVCFLTGAAGSYITGHNLMVDGGFSAGGFNK